MALERRNPLPAGVYWQDVFASSQALFDGWLIASRATVKVLKTAAHPAVGTYEPRQWVLFEVLAPTVWWGPGFPTIASKQTDESDTVQRPDPEPLFAMPTFGTGSALVIPALAVASAFVVWSIVKRS